MGFAIEGTKRTQIATGNQVRPLAVTSSLALNGGYVSGAIDFSQDIQYGGKTFTLFANVTLADVFVLSKASYDIKKFVANQGWAEISSVVNGKISGRLGIKGDGQVPTIADLISAGDVWSKLKWQDGALFTLEGLSGSDKKGRLPLGGVIIVPGGITTFTGNLPNSALVLLADLPSVVLWLYADASGNITISGEAGARITDRTFQEGYSFTAQGTELDVTRIASGDIGSFELYATGAVDMTQRLGVSVAADVLIGGIRPANVNAFVGGEYSGSFRGQGTRTIYPVDSLSGSLCASNKIWIGSELNASFRIKANLSADIKFSSIDISEIIEKNYSDKVATWVDSDLGQACAGQPKSTGMALNTQWQAKRLPSGPMRDLKVFGNRIYVAGQGGLLKSTDGGQSWSVIERSVGTVAEFQGKLVAAEERRTVRSSTDGGLTWDVGFDLTNLWGTSADVWCLAVDGNNRLWATGTLNFASTADLIIWRNEQKPPADLRCTSPSANMPAITGAMLSVEPASAGGYVKVCNLAKSNCTTHDTGLPNVYEVWRVEGGQSIIAFANIISNGVEGPHAYAISDDGITWRKLGRPPQTNFVPTAFGQLANGNISVIGLDLIGTGVDQRYTGVFMSSPPDGSNWQPITPMMNRVLSRLAFHDSNLVTVGGQYWSPATGLIWASHDNGVTWAEPSYPVTTSLRDVAASPDGIFVAVGDLGRILYGDSTGSNWIAAISNTTLDLVAVGWGAGQFLAISKDGHVLKSVNGRKWTNAQQGFSNSPPGAIGGVQYFDGKWTVATQTGGCVGGLCAPGTGGMRESIDGSTWVTVSSPGANWNSITICGGVLFALDWQRNVATLSNQASGWKYSKAGIYVDLNSQVFGLACGNDVLAFVGVNYVVGYSTDLGLTWQSSAVPMVELSRGFSFAGGKWYLYGPNDMLLVSP
jgi:hypothetical protein